MPDFNSWLPKGSRLSAVSLLALVLVLASAPTTHAQPPADLDFELVTGGLSSPLTARHAGDGSGRLFIAQQGGTIRIWDGTNLLATPFLDISGLIASGGELGLLGLAFHPDYENNGFFYVNYTEPEPNPPANCPNNPPAFCEWNTVVARYQVSAGNPNVANPASAVRILTVNQDYSNHNGGNILFGPDGYLYIGMGDGGSGGDPQNRAQNLGTLLGKMLRIDVDLGPGAGADCGAGGFYTVPLDNPFVDGPGGDCDEIWAWGLRNPWRWSFDRHTGDMLIGDVGQASVEEIDFEPFSSPGGVNYGWRCREGNVDFNNVPPCVPPLTEPILVYTHGQGCSVTGGYRYRGNVIAGLEGTYFYGDFCTQRYWLGTRNPGGSWSSTIWMENTGINPTSFGEDERGELYVTHNGGALYRIVSPSSIFTDGFESGDLSAWSATSP